MSVEQGQWYNSKRGHLCHVESVNQDGSIVAISHYTGHSIDIPKEQVEFFSEAKAPETACGVAMIDGASDVDTATSAKHNSMYEKYPHIVPGSIYKMKDNIKSKEDMEFKKIDGKMRAKTIKKDKTKAAATRCVVRCTMEGCTNTRDVKVQDVFQVKACEDCKNKKRKKNLDRMLEKKGKVTKKKTKKKAKK